MYVSPTDPPRTNLRLREWAVTCCGRARVSAGWQNLDHHALYVRQVRQQLPGAAALPAEPAAGRSLRPALPTPAALALLILSSSLQATIGIEIIDNPVDQQPCFLAQIEPADLIMEMILNLYLNLV